MTKLYPKKYKAYTLETTCLLMIGVGIRREKDH